MASLLRWIIPISKITIGAISTFIKEIALLPLQVTRATVTLGGLVVNAVQNRSGETILFPLAFCISGPIIMAVYPIVAAVYVELLFRAQQKTIFWRLHCFARHSLCGRFTPPKIESHNKMYTFPTEITCRLNYYQVRI
jgi:hypothetical protein